MSPIILPVVFKIVLMVLSTILPFAFGVKTLSLILSCPLLMGLIIAFAITAVLLSVGHIIAAVSLVKFFPMGIVVGSHLLNVPLSMPGMILPLGLIPLFSMLMPISPSELASMLSVGFVVFSLLPSHLFAMGCAVLFHLFRNLFSMLLIVLFPVGRSILTLLPLLLLLSQLFLMALSIELIVYALLFLVGCCIGFIRGTPTYFTCSRKSAFIFVEKLKGCREHLTTRASALFAGNVILGYYIGHGTSSNLVSSPGVFQHSLDTPFLPLHYTIHPPVAQLQGVY